MPRRLVVSAPARANLLGNPSDQYGGSQISCAVPMRARARFDAAEGERVVLEAETGSLVVETPDDLAPRGDLFDLPRAALRALAAEGTPLAGCRIRLESEIPLQSGLAGSTALLVALLQGALLWRGRSLPGHAVAELARAVERREMGVQCGFGDQYMAVFGRLRFLDFRGKEHDEGEGGSPFATVEALHDLVPRLPFLLAYTGLRHSSNAVHRPIRERWLRGDPEVIAGQERIAAIGREGKRALLAGDLARFGALMDENHEIQRGLGGSGESNERLIAAARAAGALGAKLAGAGDGGTIVALHRGDPAPLEAALRAAGAAALFRPEPVEGLRAERG